MTTPNNCHSLFIHNEKPCFLQKIKLKDTDEKALEKAREHLIKVIKDGFKLYKETLNVKYELPTPRFYTQGSYAYKTIIDPAYPPEQQVDLDLGVYLPFETLLDEQSPPSESAKTYFEIISATLETNNILHKIKETCIRINLNERLHVDIPLYGVPAKKFLQISETIHNRKMSISKGLLQDDIYEKLDPTCVHLAMKDGSWRPSDPKEIREWIDAICSTYGTGNQVRAICKYLKAWRDEKWKTKGGPSSIFLLACVLHNYRHINGHHHDLLREVIKALPDSLNNSVLVPAPIPGNNNYQEDLRDRLTEDDKIDFKLAFDQLYTEYENAMTTTNAEIANKSLCNLFGSRFPYDPKRIIRVPPPTPGKTVRATPALVSPLAMGEQSSGG